MAIVAQATGPKGEDMAAFYPLETASSAISFKPLAFYSKSETQTRRITYNRVEDKV